MSPWKASKSKTEYPQLFFQLAENAWPRCSFELVLKLGLHGVWSVENVAPEKGKDRRSIVLLCVGGPKALLQSLTSMFNEKQK